MRTHSTELGHRANIVKFNIYKPSPAEWPDSAQTVRRGPLISLSQVFFAPTGAQGVMMWTFNQHHSGSRLSRRLKVVLKQSASGWQVASVHLHLYIWCFYEKKTRKIKAKNIPKFLTVAQLNSKISRLMRSWESSQSDTDLFLVLRGGPGCRESYLWTVIIPVPWSQSHPGSPQT